MKYQMLLFEEHSSEVEGEPSALIGAAMIGYLDEANIRARPINVGISCSPDGEWSVHDETNDVVIITLTPSDKMRELHNADSY